MGAKEMLGSPAKELKKKRKVSSEPKDTEGKKIKLSDASEVDPGPAEALKKKSLLLSPIAQPLATEKLKKRSLKVVRKAAACKLLKRGVKEVVKALRKNQTGLCLIAADIAPIDVIAHLPVMCEDRNIPYVYVPSKEELGQAAGSKRPCSCILLTRDDAKAKADPEDKKNLQEAYDELQKRFMAVQIVY